MADLRGHVTYSDWFTWGLLSQGKSGHAISLCDSNGKYGNKILRL